MKDCGPPYSIISTKLQKLGIISGEVFRRNYNGSSCKNEQPEETMDYTIEHRAEVTSTNELCMSLGREGKEGNYVLVADSQTKGRGRLGREWLSKPGEGLYLSILERPDHMYMKYLAPITLVMALAIRKSLDDTFSMKCQIKWPNDLVFNGKKVAGILVQSSALTEKPFPIFDALTLEESIKNAKTQEGRDYIGPKVDFVVLGAGINIFHDAFPEDLQDKATSLYLEKFCEKDEIHLKKQLIISIIENWKSYYNEFLRSDFFSLWKEYNQYLAGIYTEVVVHDSAGEYTGVSLGVNAFGELEVDTAKGINTVTCGEVSVRGVNGYV